MKTTLLFSYLAIMLSANGALFNPPDGLNDLPVQNPNPSQLAHAEVYASPDGSLRVSVVQSLSAISTIESANDFIRGIRDGSAKKGHDQGETLEIRFGEFEARHIQMEMMDPSTSTAFLCDSYIVFTSEAVVNIMVLCDPKKESRRSLDWLVSHTNLPGEPITLTAAAGSEVPLSGMQRSSGSFMYEFGRQLGAFFIIVIIIAVVIVFIVRHHQRDPRARAESARRIAQYNHDDPY